MLAQRKLLLHRWSQASSVANQLALTGYSYLACHCYYHESIQMFGRKKCVLTASSSSWYDMMLVISPSS